MAKRRPSSPRPSPPGPLAAARPAAGPDQPPFSGDTAGFGPVPSPDRRPLALGALLFLVVLGVFLPALRHDFITYDDPAYVVNNPHVTGGLTGENIRWAWRSFEHSNWHPLTWMSHQLDCTLFGLQPWGHHLTNLLLHATSALLLFLVLRRATGFLWRSVVVAALFGLHPLRVESVAWIAERKDVLSTLFWMLTLWAYVAYVQRRRAGQPHAGRLYALALLALAVGLTAKPMLVTLPCVLLLLDLWPLGRWPAADARGRLRLLAEKLPFLALSAASCVLTYLAQQRGGAVKAMEDFTWAGRAANALLAYAQYLGKLFWPTRLAVLYPHSGEPPPAGPTLLAAALLVALTGAAIIALRRGRPWALVGWLWFLGTLVPVIGLVQVGGQTMADRYSYVPTIGVLLVVVWAVAEGTARLPRRPAVLGTAAATAVGVCGVLTARQLPLWRDSITLFRHPVAVTRDNWMAHYNLSLAYGRSPATAAEARAEFQKMVTIIGTFAERHNRRGLALLQDAARQPEALAEFDKAVRIKGDYAEAHHNRGLVLQRLPGRLPAAIEAFETALRHEPELAEAKLNLGRALAQVPSRRHEAVAHLRLAVWLLPERADARCALAAALAADPSRRSSAVAEYEAALRLDPNCDEARTGLAALLGGPR